MEILVDDELPPPAPDAGVAAWEAWCDRLAPGEHAETGDAEWLAASAIKFGGALEIPAVIAADRRLTSRTRAVLAALMEIARDVDVTRPEITLAVTHRLFGSVDSEFGARVVVPALAELVTEGLVTRTRAGGFVL